MSKTKLDHDAESSISIDHGNGTVEDLGYTQVYRRVFRTIANVSLVLALAMYVSY